MTGIARLVLPECVSALSRELLPSDAHQAGCASRENMIPQPRLVVIEGTGGKSLSMN